MALCRLFLRSVRRPSASAQPLFHFLHLTPNPAENPQSLQIYRSFAFSSAEEAAAERRRRKRRLRIEPPLHALRPPPNPHHVHDPNAKRLPDSTSQLTGARLQLHNRVQSLIRASDLDAASLLARSAVFSNTRPTVFTCNAIIAAMYRNKRFDEAIALFHYFFKQSNIVPNVVSYNNLINTYCDRGEVDIALEVYRDILADAPFSPSPVTYKHLTKGLVDAGRIGEAVDLLREMLNKGHGADSLVFNNVVSGFLNLGNLEKANELFDELKERCMVYDGIVNATFMEWWFNQGKDKEAMESYRSYLDRKFRLIPATCNVLLEVLLKHGKKKEAWDLFEEMLDNHKPPNTQAVNSDTFNIMVNECFKLGKFEEAIQTFKKAGSRAGSKPFAMDVAGYSNIIIRFCEHRMLSDADMLFKELLGKSLSSDVTTYRTLIDAYLKAERVDDALELFSKMVEYGLRVVASFGSRVFSEFLKNGKNEESAWLLTKMGEKDPKPDALIYDVVVRGLCNAGELDKSRDILVQMMRYGVGVTPALQEFVRDVFGRAGRNEEIEVVLNETRLAPPPRPAGPPRTRPWGQPQQSHGELSRNNMASQYGPGSHQMAGQHASGFSQVARQQQYTGPLNAPQMGGQQPPVPSQSYGQQPYGNSQYAGQQQPWGSTQAAAHTAGQQAWGAAQTQTVGQQQHWGSTQTSTQTAGQQSWSSPEMAQTGGRHSWGSPQMAPQTPYGPMSGQQNYTPSQYPEPHPYGSSDQMAGGGQQRPPWSPQMSPPQPSDAPAPQESRQDQSGAYDWQENHRHAAACK